MRAEVNYPALSQSSHKDGALVFKEEGLAILAVAHPPG